MKRYFLYIATAAVLFLPAACNKEPHEEEKPTIPDEEEELVIPETGVITMTTLASEVSLGIIPIGTDVLIDWGNGEKSNANDASSYDYSSYYYFSHSYSSSAEHRITIYGDIIDLLCHFNQLTTLEVSGASALTRLHCSYNQLTTLDVSSNTALTELTCLANQLTTLNVSGATALRDLYCNHNQLTTLDVSSNTALTYLQCHDNLLNTLDVSTNTALTLLYCSNNQLTASALNHLFGTLRVGYSYTPCPRCRPQFLIWIYDNPGASDCDVSIAEGKEWRVYGSGL